MTNHRPTNCIRTVAATCLRCAAAIMIVLLSACSTDYVNVIPSNSTAVMAFDPTAMAMQSGMSDNDRAAVLKTALNIDDVNDCGIDLNQKLYAFETADGTLGLVAAVSSNGDLDKWIDQLTEKKICTKPTEKKGFKFAVLHNNFVVGYSSQALLIMGPTIGAAQAELQRKMAKWLKADGDNGIRESRLFERLETMNSPVALVAQAQAMPDKVAALFTLGTPKGTQPTDIYIAATMNSNGHGCLEIEGESFAFDQTTDKALKDAAATYKSIDGGLLDRIPDNAQMVMACGMDGANYLQLLRGNDALRALLLGANTAIDIDKMIKGIKGDVVVVVTQGDDNKVPFQMVAQVDGADWLADVAYWKTSCPEGSSITNGHSQNTFLLKSADWNICFAQKGKELLLGSSEVMVEAMGKKADKPMATALTDKMKGKRLCVLANVKGIADSHAEANTAVSLLKPLFGEINTVAYSMK